MLVTEPGDALAKGIPIGEPERSAMLQLMGRAVALFQNPAPLAPTERDALNQLIGLLCARLHEAALAQRLAYLEYQIADLQRQITRSTN